MTSAEGTPLQEASGYDRLGWLMGKYGDMSIFRRFGALSAETLLHKQAELQELEVKLREQQENDRASGHPDRQKYHRSWWLVHHSADSEAIEGNDPRQLELLTEIDAKVKKYHEALLRHRQIMNLTKPTRKKIKSLVGWMERIDRGNISLIGEDRCIWREPDMDDLVMMRSDDFFTSSITPTLVCWYHQFLGRYIHKEETSGDLKNSVLYDDDRVSAVIRTISALLACLIMMGSIAVLYSINDMRWRIGVTAIFTVTFALLLSVTTDVKIKDIFGATAAFAAVLVVFIGTNDSTN